MSDVELPARMQCPNCPYTVVCSEEDPDAGMGNLWNHLYWDHALGSVANPRAFTGTLLAKAKVVPL